jgi:hypothetical protein
MTDEKRRFAISGNDRSLNDFEYRLIASIIEDDSQPVQGKNLIFL